MFAAPGAAARAQPMGKTLIIAEKPSVAGDIAKALGGFKRGKEYYESDRHLLSWAVGHLFQLAVPAALKEQDKWALDKLPIMPDEFDLTPVEKMGGRVKTLCQLLKDKSVTEVINACDAGREGELIFRYIMQYAGTHKPVKRLWLQSMTPEAIRDGFARLRDDAELQPLAAAARSRNEADWLVGINATRAFTLRLSGGRGSTVTSLGRVQTPTLAIIVEREEKIQEFKPRELHEIFGHFHAAAGEYAGRWFDENFKKEEGEPERTKRLLSRLQLNLPDAGQRLDAANGSLWDEHRLAARVWHRGIAEAIERRCQGRAGVVELEEKKPSTQAPPQLYDLTTLQREANNRLGFSAKRTLQIAQALYEKFKAITYPRTDSRCLPEDYQPTVKAALGRFDPVAGLGPLARKVLANDWVKPNKRIFNDAKVADHFAIIPTGNFPSALGNDERAVFEMIAKRFVAVFFPAAQFENTARVTRVEGEPFKTEGKILVAPGWLEVYGREVPGDGENLPAVKPGERVTTGRIEVKSDQTRPPARYTEATILSAMEGAGKLVEDEELRDAMKEKGLGTPATRAAIIETLIAAYYLVRQGKELQPTAKAIQTISLLKNAVPELTSPEMTGEWEFRLRAIEHRQLTRDGFMRDIRALTREIVGKARQFHPDEPVSDREPFGRCPKCRQPVVERFKSFTCTNAACDFTVWKTIAGRLLGREEFETLLRDRQAGPFGGFRSKKGKRFNAVLKLSPDNRVEFDFGNGPSNENPDSSRGAAVDFTSQEPLGPCPKCGARVFDAGMSYLCEKAAGAGKTCSFRSGKIILQQPVEPAQFTKLLAQGKTDLLTGFVSRKTGRKFEAFLGLKDGEVKFEFVPRERKPKAKGAKPKAPPPKLDFTGQETLGPCPKCGGRVFEGPQSYVCEKSQAERKPCKFKISRRILQQPIERAQAQKLLAARRTDLLDKFVSAKTGRPFPAFLVMDDTGKITFEFPPREGGAEIKQPL
jgi:DNA topoisomerase-3